MTRTPNPERQTKFFPVLCAVATLVVVAALIGETLTIRHLGAASLALLERQQKVEQENSALSETCADLNAQNEKYADDIDELTRLVRDLGDALAESSTRAPANPTADIVADAEYVIRIEAGGKNEGDPRVFYGNGSGFIITYRGRQYVVTVSHLRWDIQSITSTVAIFRNHLRIPPQPLEFLGDDPDMDIAVYQFVDHAFVFPGRTAELEETDDLRPGEPVISLGWPEGFWFFPGNGNVGNPHECGLNRGRTQPLLITHTAPVNKGNSGGPLVLCRTGKVVGMNTGVLTGRRKNPDAPSPTDNTFIFPISNAVPSADIVKMLPFLIAGGRPNHATANAEFWDSTQLTTETDLAMFGLHRNAAEGVYALFVEPESNAAKAGLCPGDHVVSANGTELRSATDLDRLIFFSAPGSTLHIIVERKGKLLEGEFALDALHAPEGK